jgi:hypothetical protein
MRSKLYLKDVKKLIIENQEKLLIYLLTFVDHFRYRKDLTLIEEPFELDNEQIDALLASVVEYLCDEMQLDIPAWIKKIPPLKFPYFIIFGVEELKACAIIQSPLRFKMRNIFVLDGFLDRI